MQTWPPQYTLRRSKRAKYVNFKVSSQVGLEIVVPYRFSLKHLPKVLQEKRAWIEKHLSQVLPILQQPLQLPDRIMLPSVQQHWQLNYIAAQRRLKIIATPGQYISLVGDIDDRDACQAALIKWLKSHAKHHFTNWMDSLCDMTGLKYQRLVIRGPKTRWGSCSSTQSISLSYKLLFLDAHLVRHVMLHELCHTVQLDHSEAFWKLLENFDSHWRQHRAELRQADRSLPAWIG